MLELGIKLRMGQGRKFQNPAIADPGLVGLREGKTKPKKETDQ